MHIGLMHGRNDTFCQLTDSLFGAGADGVAGAVFRDTVRFTGELDAGTLTVKKIFNGNKYITNKYKYLGSKYKYKYFTCKYKYIKMYLSTSTKYPISGFRHSQKSALQVLKYYVRTRSQCINSFAPYLPYYSHWTA